MKLKLLDVIKVILLHTKPSHKMSDEIDYNLSTIPADFELNNIRVKYLFLDSESIGNEMYSYPKTDEKVVILQTNGGYVLEAMHINEIQIHISNWKDFMISPISNYLLYGAYSVVEAFVFSNDCSDEMIVEEIRKYFEKEPSNPLHISKFNGYENPITLSR